MRSYMHKTLVTLTAAAGFVLACASAQAAVLYSSASGSLSSATATVGVQFTANANITITQLGFYDDSLDGNTFTHGVGLYTDGGTLLRSTTIQAGLASPATGDFRYEFITPYTLTSGTTYRLGSEVFSGADFYLDQGGISYTLGASVTVLDGVYSGAVVLTFPSSNAGGGTPYIGPSFTDAPIPAPEPGSLTLLIFGSIGVMRVIRRR